MKIFKLGDSVDKKLKRYIPWNDPAARWVRRSPRRGARWAEAVATPYGLGGGQRGAGGEGFADGGEGPAGGGYDLRVAVDGEISLLLKLEGK